VRAKREGDEGGAEYDQSTLYAVMKTEK
jgi:hypothetical protein